MSTVLINSIQFANVAAAGQATLPHGLILDGTGLTPDRLDRDNGAFSIVVVTPTDITVQNDGAAPGTLNLLCQHWHSIVRALPPGVVNLTPQPFVPAAGGVGGSGFTEDAVLFGAADGSITEDPTNFEYDPGTNQLTIFNGASGLSVPSAVEVGLVADGATRWIVGPTQLYPLLGGAPGGYDIGVVGTNPVNNIRMEGTLSFSANEIAIRPTATGLEMRADGDVQALEYDDNADAGNTRLLLYDVDTGAIVRVSVGADDSGGLGFKLLRVPN